MAEIVERIARAIACAQLSRNYVDLTSLKNAGVLGAAIEIDRVWPQFVPEALDVLKAMREPTLGMLRAGHRANDSDYDGPSVRDARNVWRAMIDKGLR